MNHIIKFPNNHTLSAFSKKCNEAPFHSCSLTRQNVSSNQHLGYRMDKNARLKENVGRSQKAEEGREIKLEKTDLLKVTKTHATQKQMNISKLKPSHIMAFAQQPGMILQNINSMKADHNHLNLIKMGALGTEYDTHEIYSAVNHSIIKFMKRRVTVLKANYKNPFHTIWEAESDYRYRIRFWVAYTDVCLNGNLSNLTLNVLLAHRGRSLPYETTLINYARYKKHLKDHLLNLFDPEKAVVSPKLMALYFNCLYQSNLHNDLKLTKAKEALSMFQAQENKSVYDVISTIEMYHMKGALKLFKEACPNFSDFGADPRFPPDSRLVERLYKSGKCRVVASRPEMEKSDFMKLVGEQLKLEKSVLLQVNSIFHKKKPVKETKDRMWEDLMSFWRVKFQEGLLERMNGMEKSHGSDDLQLYPFLNCLPTKDMVDFMIGEVSNLFLKSDLYTSSLRAMYRDIGENLWLRYNMENLVKRGRFKLYESMVRKYMEWYYEAKDGSDVNYRQKWESILWDCVDESDMNQFNVFWGDDVSLKVGRLLSQLMFKSAIIPSHYLNNSHGSHDVPAFYIVYRYTGKKYMIPQLKIHPSVRSIFASTRSGKLFFSVKSLPMLCPPQPWVSSRSGGFFLFNSRFIRFTDYNYSQRIVNRFPNAMLYTVFDSLNELQSVAWVMNTKVLDVAIEVFKNGGSEELNVPVDPKTMHVPNRESGAMFYAYRAALQKKAEAYGLWCECLYKLSLANHFRDKILWLPYNLDFRGRVYPIPPHINHICADLYRSLYLFAEKKPLGPKGLDWLKIHCINLQGTHKKNSLAERLAHANKVLPDIIDSAEKPLKGRRWWGKADDPWQALATCIEIANALKSGNPETYETGFPVHQDGSCNGLQHYAALGRDPIGAASVNLAPSEYPQDVYEVVVSIVEGLRKKDAANGVAIAEAVRGFVLRKVLKQTVMTTVYGVTIFGAKAQIANKLKSFKEFPPHLVNSASLYLTKKVFQALNEMFTSAQELQNWFSSCARIITSKFEKHVTWVTPIGLPVTQPYFSKNQPRGTMMFRPSSRKQRSAFPANFVHSLDSSHMMLTALACGAEGITFASVHDCFWTHPADVDRMNVICREKFIELHSEDIIGNLSEHFLRNYLEENNQGETMKAARLKFKSIPKKGKFDLNDVAKSTYFFS